MDKVKVMEDRLQKVYLVRFGPFLNTFSQMLYKEYTKNSFSAGLGINVVVDLWLGFGDQLFLDVNFFCITWGLLILINLAKWGVFRT